MLNEWLELAANIAKAPPAHGRLFCPHCGKAEVDFQYVGDLKDRIGSLDVWCNACLKGVHISRAAAPAFAEMLPFNTPAQELNERIPKYSHCFSTKGGVAQDILISIPPKFAMLHDWKSKPENNHQDPLGQSVAELTEAALREFREHGKVVSTRCDLCGRVIEIKWLGEKRSGVSLKCSCGKFHGTFRGLLN